MSCITTQLQTSLNDDDDNVTNNGNDDAALIQELSFKVRLPRNVAYYDSVPRFPQKGRYAFPAGLAHERASFGWLMKSDGSHTNTTGNRRTRRYRCLEQFLECDKCLKVVDISDDNDKSQSNKQKRKIDSGDDEKQIALVEEEEKEKNRLCIDSPRCDGVLRRKNCAVVSSLVVEPFLATLEVSENHLHRQRREQQQQQKQKSLVQVTSVQIRSAITNNAPTEITKEESNKKRKKSEPQQQQQQTVTLPNTIISTAVANSIEQQRRGAYLEAELSALTMFNNDDRSSLLSTDRNALITMIRYELLFITLALARSEKDSLVWQRNVSKVMLERVSNLIRLPWFASLYVAVLFVVRQHSSSIFDSADNDDADDNIQHRFVDRLLAASVGIALNCIFSKIDVESSSSNNGNKNTNQQLTLEFVATELAKRIAFPSERCSAIQSQLRLLHSPSTLLSMSLDENNTLASNNLVVEDATIITTANTAITGINQSSSLVEICQRLSKAYDDSKLFSVSLLCEDFVAMFLNAFAVEAKQIDSILSDERRQQEQQHSIEFSSVFNASLSADVTYQLSIRHADDWLGALAIVCSDRAIDDVRLELRLAALLELNEHRQHYCESIGGLKFLCDMIDDLVGNNWQASLRQELLVVFANLWKAPIQIINFQSNEKSIIALPLRHNVKDCITEMGLVLGQSNDKTFNVLRSRNVKSLQQTTQFNAILPSNNCIELAQPFADHFTSRISIIIDNTRQSSYSTTTTMSDRFNLLLSANDLNDVVLSDSSLDKACQVRLRDLRRLLSTNEWLNDEIVNVLISLAVRSTSKCDAFSSFIVKKLASDDDNWIERYQSFRGKTFRELLTEKISILIPWHTDENHWSLFFINPVNKEILYVDSLSSKTIRELKLAQRLFRLIGVDNQQQYRLRMNVDSPQQQDIVNCGAFVALNAWKLAHQQRLTSTPPYFTESNAMRCALARSVVNSSSDWPL